MITAALAVIFTWCLFFGRVPQPFLIVICVVTGAFLVFVSRHKHTHILSIDVLVHTTRLKKVNTALKFWTLLGLMIISVASRNAATGLFLTVAMFALAVFVGRLSVRHYIQILALPVLFLLVGGLALLFEVSSGQTGVLNVKIFGFWLSVSAASQTRTALVVSRALGAVSCLNLLGVTAPMPEIIGVLRRARCPGLIIDLMYLIYRYIFILLSLHHDMYNAAKSRLGFSNYRTSLRATGKIYSNLLARSYQFAGRNFDAMESRCYNTEIRFLEHPKRITSLQAGVSVSLLLVSLCISILPL